jgi:hypothetical protein
MRQLNAVVATLGTRLSAKCCSSDFRYSLAVSSRTFTYRMLLYTHIVAAKKCLKLHIHSHVLEVARCNVKSRNYYNACI